jgi:hypothetical protein
MAMENLDGHHVVSRDVFDNADVGVVLVIPQADPGADCKRFGVDGVVSGRGDVSPRPIGEIDMDKSGDAVNVMGREFEGVWARTLAPSLALARIASDMGGE